MSEISQDGCPVWAPFVGFTGVLFALVFASEFRKRNRTRTTLYCKPDKSYSIPRVFICVQDVTDQHVRKYNELLYIHMNNKIVVVFPDRVIRTTMEF